MIKPYWIYILYCENNSYYTGYTTDLHKRYECHLSGKGSKYTRSFRPCGIAQSWKLICKKSVAMQIERNIKKLSRSQKEKLIDSSSLLEIFFKENLIDCVLLE